MLHGYSGTTFKPAKGVQVYTGGSFKPAKSVRRYTNGAWVSVLQTQATLALSGSNLVVTATIPSLVQTYQWWYYIGTTWTMHSSSTATTLAPSVVPTATKWAVIAVQYDAIQITTNEVTTYVPPTSTVSVVAPAYCTATISPNTNNNIIVNPKFTITIGTPASVKKVSLQVKHSTASVYTEVASTTTGITSTITSATTQFTLDGLWNIQVVITLTDDKTVTSAIDQMICVRRTITVTASDYSPDVGTSSVLTASMSSAAPAGFPNTPLGWEYDDTSTTTGWVDWHSTTPYTWAVPSDYAPVKFRWSEQFPDGSKLYSNTMTVDAVPLTSVKGTGGTQATLQAVLDQGYTKNLPVILTGSWTISGRVYIPPNVRVTATGATFSGYSGGSMFSNAGPQNQHDTTTGASGWNKGGNWIWDGGNFDARNVASTAFSLVHCPKFTIKNCTIWNTASPGHGIEINSCGGTWNTKYVTAMADADFTVQILNNTFLGMDAARRAGDFDEAIHFDYSWTDGSSSGSQNDGTVCNNILISGNTVKRTRTYSYPVAVGHHHSITDNSGGRALPDAQHKNIKIVGNTFMDVVPTDVGNERGAVHIHSGAKYVYIVSNTFLRCAMAVSMEPRTHPTGIAAWGASQYYWINSNTFNACGTSGNKPQVSGEAGGTGGAQWYNVTVSANTFTGAVPAAQTDYMIVFRDTTTLVITNNKFWGLTGSSALVASGGNRICGTPDSLPSGTTGMTLSGNTWASAASGSGAVSANS